MTTFKGFLRGGVPGRHPERTNFSRDHLFDTAVAEIVSAVGRRSPLGRRKTHATARLTWSACAARSMSSAALARQGAERLWSLLHTEDYVNALGALTGGQAVEMVKAGLKAIYLSGWQVAADANLSENVYPDQSLYAVNSVPAVVRRINNALRRADQIEWAEASGHARPRERASPPPLDGAIVADAEAGFGGALNAFELMKAMIEAGRRACTSKTSCRRRRSAATWAARSWSRPRSTSAPSTPPVWPPTCAACRRWSWPAPTRSGPT